MTKLTIESYTDEKFQDKKGEIEVQYNPANYSINWGMGAGVESGKGRQDDGTVQLLTGGKKKDVKKTDMGPPSVSFELVFDDSLYTDSKQTTVSDRIQKLKELCVEVDPEVHGINYIVLSWGDFLFKCQLSSLQVKYELFLPDGTPLRAKVSCSFKNFQDALTDAISTDMKSPDMTRVVTVVEGDTLPLLCFRYYGSSRHYLKVAKVNGLPSASFLRPGQQIVFPPLVDDIQSYYN
jgi:nucleoid-associated protein YgaU